MRKLLRLSAVTAFVSVALTGTAWAQAGQQGLIGLNSDDWSRDGAAAGFDLHAATVSEADFSETTPGLQTTGSFDTTIDDARTVGCRRNGDVQTNGIVGESGGAVPGEGVKRHGQKTGRAFHLSFVICHLSFVICHLSFVITPFYFSCTIGG